MMLDGQTIFTGGGSKDDLDIPDWRQTSGARAAKPTRS